MMLTNQLLTVADIYCRATGRGRARVSTLALNQGGKLAAIAAGAGITTRRMEQALAWFSANWPDGAAWPEGVARPAAAGAVETADTGEAA